MKRKGIFRLSVLLGTFILTAVFLYGCTAETQPQQGEFLDNNLDMLIGPQTEPLEVLDAAALEGKSFSDQPPVPVSAILGREPGYESIHDDMMSLLENSLPELYPGLSGFYYASVPVYHFRAVDGEVADSADIYLFDDQKTCIGCVVLFSDGGMVYNGSNDIENGDFLRRYPGERFVFIYNGKCNLLLSAGNEVYPAEIYKNADYDYDFSVAGDYYGAVPNEMLAVSYGSIMDSLVRAELSAHTDS